MIGSQFGLVEAGFLVKRYDACAPQPEVVLEAEPCSCYLPRPRLASHLTQGRSYKPAAIALQYLCRYNIQYKWTPLISLKPGWSTLDLSAV